MRIIFQFPDWLQSLYRGVVWRVRSTGKVIYLTFDDGCIPEITPRVLDILNRYGVKATFFCVGENIEKYPHIFRMLIDGGHAIGNHTYHHLPGWQTPTPDYLEDVLKTDAVIDSHLSKEDAQKRVRLFRPPYGRMRAGQKKALCRSHKVVLWDVLTHDYNPCYTPEQIMRAIRKYSRNGSVVVFHDSLKASGNMLAVLPQVLEFWLQEGYTLRTLNDLTY